MTLKRIDITAKTSSHQLAGVLYAVFVLFGNSTRHATDTRKRYEMSCNASLSNKLEGLVKVTSGRVWVLLTNNNRFYFVIQQTSSSSTKFNIISIIFSTTYSLHPQLSHSAIISGEDHTVSCFLNILDILWTPTSLPEYYIKYLLTLLCKNLHTHWIMYILTLYCIFVVNILLSVKSRPLNEYVMLC